MVEESLGNRYRDCSGQFKLYDWVYRNLCYEMTNDTCLIFLLVFVFFMNPRPLQQSDLAVGSTAEY